MTSREYYYQHFSELNPDKKFHFATRIKNYFKVSDFDEYLRNNQPSANLAEIFADNDFSKVNNYSLRKPFFEKYDGIYGIEAALFRVHHLLMEYGLDTRAEFLKICPRDKLYRLADGLLADPAALKILSTWAVNVIYLTEELFPRNEDTIRRMGEWALGLKKSSIDPTLLSYLYTHIFLCESGFYSKDVLESKNLKLLKRLLAECAEAIKDNIDTISLDAAIEFLVCCNMAGVDYPKLRTKIAGICNDFKKDAPYLINYRHDKTPNSYFYTLNGAEHINVLYIMSGLDK